MRAEGFGLSYQRLVALVLIDQRAVERDLHAVEGGTAEAEALRAEGARLRAEYRRLVRAELEHYRPAVPPARTTSEAGRN